MPSSPASISARMTSTSPRPSATRIPARIIESDAGRMTDRIVRERHICSVRAFSSSTGSSPLTPWNVLIRTGNTAASTTSAIIVVALSMPRNRNSTGTSAGELGSATESFLLEEEKWFREVDTDNDGFVAPGEFTSQNCGGGPSEASKTVSGIVPWSLKDDGLPMSAPGG